MVFNVISVVALILSVISLGFFFALVYILGSELRKLNDSKDMFSNIFGGDLFGSSKEDQ